jgi:hypothetical protein
VHCRIGAGKSSARVIPASDEDVNQCTECDSANVRRSGMHPAERGMHPLQVPFRCNDCGTRFWVIGPPVRRAGLVLVVALMLVVVPIAVYEQTSQATAQPVPRITPSADTSDPDLTEQALRQLLDVRPLSDPSSTRSIDR